MMDKDIELELAGRLAAFEFLVEVVFANQLADLSERDANDFVLQAIDRLSVSSTPTKGDPELEVIAEHCASNGERVALNALSRAANLRDLRRR